MSRNSSNQIGAVISETTRALSEAGVHQPRLEAEWLVSHVLQNPRVEVLARNTESMSANQRTAVGELLKRRQAREPVQYILESQEFWGFEFSVGPGVLIPRPETEHLIESVLGQFPQTDSPLMGADLGTGSGCLAITLALIYEQSRFFATDVSEKALCVARANTRRHSVEGRVSCLGGDLANPLERVGLGAELNLVVSNPPYIPASQIKGLQREVSRFEPAIALDGGSDGLGFYRRIFREAGRFIRPGGFLFLEIGQGQHEAVVNMGSGSGWISIRTIHDLQGIARTISFQKPG